MIVNKAWSHHSAVRINDPVRGSTQFADFRNLAVLHSNITTEGGHTGTIDDATIANQQIIGHRLGFLPRTVPSNRRFRRNVAPPSHFAYSGTRDGNVSTGERLPFSRKGGTPHYGLVQSLSGRVPPGYNAASRVGSACGSDIRPVVRAHWAPRR